jgi:hypothetical protein
MGPVNPKGQASCNWQINRSKPRNIVNYRISYVMVTSSVMSF